MCNACAGEDLFLPCLTAEPKKKRLGKRQRASHSYQYLTKRKHELTPVKQRAKKLLFFPHPGFSVILKLTCLVLPGLIVL